MEFDAKKKDSTDLVYSSSFTGEKTGKPQRAVTYARLKLTEDSPIQVVFSETNKRGVNEWRKVYLWLQELPLPHSVSQQGVCKAKTVTTCCKPEGTERNSVDGYIEFLKILNKMTIPWVRSKVTFEGKPH